MGTICENELDKSIEEYKWKIKILHQKINQLWLELLQMILIFFH